MKACIRGEFSEFMISRKESSEWGMRKTPTFNRNQSGGLKITVRK